MSSLFADDVDLVEMALSRGDDVNAPNDEGVVPLHKACAEGNADVVKLLLSKGASPNLEDKTPRGASPLHYAAEAYAADPEGDPRFEEVLRALVGAGAVGIFDRKNALPDPGDDADYQVAALVQQAEKAGEAERAAQRDRRRRANTDLINAKQKEYQDGCSAAMVAVMEAGSHEGYKGAMHLGPG